jgi:hypothetical protein
VTEYDSLLTRAVAALQNNTNQTRENLYERAREALLRQLRNNDPPFSETEIAREQFALEAAITRVEAESRADSVSTATCLAEEFA